MKTIKSLPYMMVLLTLTLFIACGGGSNSDKKELSSTKSQTPFSIQSFYPSNGAKDVALDAKIKITFNKPIDHIDQNSITMSSFSITDKASNSVSGSFSYQAKSIIFTPYDDLQPDTKYMVEITNAIKDRDGKSLGLSQTATFTTAGKKSEPNPFKVLSTLPVNNSIDIALDTQIIIYLSHAVDITTATTNQISLLNSSNIKIPITISPNGKQIVIKPQQPLKGLSLYRVNLSGLKDDSGTILPLYSFSFKTAKEPITPLNFDIQLSKTTAIQGESVNFSAINVTGNPTAYDWSSDRDGQLSTQQSFSKK